jgi:hypothetical protein
MTDTIVNVEAIAEFGRSSGIFRFMNTTWGWPTIESIHFVGLSLLVGAVWLFDLRLLGFAKNIPIAALHKLVPWGVLGYLVNVSTGFLFYVSAPDQYTYNPAFQLKVLCMIIAGLNVIAFYTTTSARLKTLGIDEPVPLQAKMMAAISLSAWIGVIVFGRLITFYRPPEHWCFWC